MEFFDSHAHYNDEKYNEDREDIIKKAYSQGIRKIVVAGYNANSSKEAIEIANKYEFIYATCGISPNDIENYKQEFESIKKMASNEKIVAIGEIGLDYYWNKDNKEEQKNSFIEQIELANNLKLPIVIHTREAVYDTLDILKNAIKPVKGAVFHCCPLNPELIKEVIKLGYYVSFAGPVTFRNAKNADECIKLVPNDKIMIETDSPYLTPDPFRGTRNNSENVKLIAEKIARVREMSIEDIAKLTSDNAKLIFNIKN